VHRLPGAGSPEIQGGNNKINLDEADVQPEHEEMAERRRIAQKGIEVRAGIDAETVRDLQLINGGMAAGFASITLS
jgi:hypothetical protein